MSALPEVLSDNLVFLRGEDVVERLADKLQRKKIGCSAVREYRDLDLDGEAPRRGGRLHIVKTGESDKKVSKIADQSPRTAYPGGDEDLGMSRRDLSLAPLFALLMIAARNLCNGRSLEKPVILELVTTWINELR